MCFLVDCAREGDVGSGASTFLPSVIYCRKKKRSINKIIVRSVIYFNKERSVGNVMFLKKELL